MCGSFPFAGGVVHAATRSQIEQNAAWREALGRSFAHVRKDARYYQIVEETIDQGFEYGYLLVEIEGQVRAVQPFFVLNQDLLAGAVAAARRPVEVMRRVFPRLLTLRTLMVGCAAGEGHMDAADASVAAALHQALPLLARMVKASLIVFKEFPSTYRESLGCLARDGYTRMPSLPMTRLWIGYENFEDYMAKALSKAMRKDLRRKFKATAGEAGGIELTVVSDVTQWIDEAYPLYLNVYERSKLRFEKLTKEYLCRLGREMPDKVRFFLWRRRGKLVAFSVCMLQGDSLYDEYLGLDYEVALDLHLYFYTIRDVINWAIGQGLKWYCSSALNYDPKLHLKCELVPLDLYVTHTSRVANFVLRRVLPWVAPTRGDKVLPRFPNYAAVWGESNE
jgi:hypothetical protein